MKQKTTNLYRFFLIYFLVYTTSFLIIYILVSNPIENVVARRIVFIGLLLMVFIISNIFVLYLLKKVFILNRKHEKIDLELLKYQYMESDLKLYRQHRHDIKNHLTVMYELVQSENYDDLKDYTKKYIDQTSNQLRQINTGIDELDVLIYNKVDYAKSNHINIDFHCLIELNAHNNSVIDIVSIFSNLLDNAIEANKQILDTNERTLSISIADDQLDYILVITNAFISEHDANDFTKDGFTTKTDVKNHGLGTGIVEKLVSKYGGHLNIDILDKKFYQVKIELPKHQI